MSTTAADRGPGEAATPAASPAPGATTVDAATVDPATVDAADVGARATVESEVSSRPKHDLPVLEAYRGIAALMVVFTHVGFISGSGVIGPWAGWLSRLDFGVTLFFLLSGFLLFRPFVQAAYGRRPPVSVGSYFRRRYLRIYPAFITVLVVDYLITPDARTVSGDRWLQTVLMIQNYTGNFANQLPGMNQIWSLAVEVSFYLALPFLVWTVLGPGAAAAGASARVQEVRALAAQTSPAQRRRAELARRRQPLVKRIRGGRPWRLEVAALRPGIVLVVIVAFSFGWRLYYMLRHGGLGNQLVWLPAYLDWFAAGMALAWLREREAPVPQLLRYIANSPGACWSLALAGYWLATTKLGGPYDLRGPTTAEAMLKHLIFLVIAALLLLPAVFGDTSARWRRIASNRFFSWLGQISFGVFLWHPMLLAAIRRALGWVPFDGHFWISLVLTLAVSLVAGSLSWKYVEEPLQRRWRNGFGVRYAVR
jgi:peptidoglycan/LPS O-acetylase OafA/YrhL